jgi:phage baseplate assembly protein W
MADLDQLWGNDLSIAGSGDVATVDGSINGTQRVIRRLLSNPGDLLAHPEYGAGLRKLIGKAVPPSTIEAVIRGQIFLEAAVARTPDPVISISPDMSGAFGVNVKYWDATSGAPQLLDFNVTP